MFCSPLLHPAPTTIPPAIRDWLGARLSGPPRGVRRRRRRACVFALGWIGDFVLTLSAVRLLLRESGPADCVLVVSEAAAPLSLREFPKTPCLTLPADAASLVRDIVPAWWRHRGKFSKDFFQNRICLSHQRPLLYEVALSWIDAENDVRLLPGTYPAPTDGWCTELLAHQRLVERVLQRPVDREEILPRFTSLAPGNDGRLLVYPFARDTNRSLSPQHVIRVLQHWRKRSRAPVVLGGGPADEPALLRCVELARAAGLENLGLETPFGVDGLLRHVARAGALLTPDSAAAHIAAALDKSSTVLTNPGFFGYCQPWTRSGRQKVFRDDEPAEVVADALPAL